MTTDFQTQLAALKELQEIDLRLDKIANDLDKLPERIAETESRYFQIKEEFDNVVNELNETEQLKKKEEKELEYSSEELKKRETKLYAIKTNKEYQAVLKEIADTKKLNKEREERILTYMEKIEFLSKKNTQLSGELADKKVGYEKEKNLLEIDEQEFKKQLVEYEEKRPEIEGKLDKVFLRKYNFVRARYDSAIVSVKNGVCQGCSMNIPVQLYNEVLHLIELKNCPSCHRMIYVELPVDEADKEEEKL